VTAVLRLSSAARYRDGDFVTAALMRTRMPWLSRDQDAVPTRAEALAAVAAVAAAWGQKPPGRRVRAIFDAFAAPLAGSGDTCAQRAEGGDVTLGWLLAGDALATVRALPPFAWATLVLACLLCEAMLRRAYALGARPEGGAELHRHRMREVLAALLVRDGARWTYFSDADVEVAWRLAEDALGASWQPPAQA
jgi:hypothetical protein